MPYTTNPKLPKLRMDAVVLLRDGWSTRKVARHLGFNQSTIVRWFERSLRHRSSRILPTRSSRPHHSPRALSSELVSLIIQYRQEHRRCAEVIHHLMVRDGIAVSLSSVKRTIRRWCVKRSPWKRWHFSLPRPKAEKPGDLVQIDTVHRGRPEERKIYIYTLVDVFSRWAHAVPVLGINTHRSLQFVRAAQEKVSFHFIMLQSDNGPEFSKWFTQRAAERGFAHRHSRVRTPTDNGHLERFNRTIQEECLDRLPKKLSAYKKELPEYLQFYNAERPHLGLNLKTPLEVMRSS